MYTTGVTILDNSVELINPPSIIMANGALNGLVESAMGNNPPIAVRNMSTMERNGLHPLHGSHHPRHAGCPKLIGKIDEQDWNIFQYVSNDSDAFDNLLAVLSK